MFFIFPVGVDYRANRYPVVTFTIIGVNVAVFLLSILLALQGAGREWEFEHLWLIPGNPSWHAYVTAAFVHFGFLHLIFNMAYLYLFGACVEDVIGRGRFVLFYLLGILSASFLYVLFSGDGPRSEVPMGGASGAVSACIGGFLLLMARTKVEFKWVFWIFVRAWSGEWFFPAWMPISLWFLSDLLGMVANMAEGESGGGVAFAAHVGGTIGGIIMIVGYKKWIESKEQASEQPLLAVPSVATAQGPPTTYLYQNGQQTGPYPRAQLIQLARLRSIAPDAQYWEEGMPEWRPISEIENL